MTDIVICGEALGTDEEAARGTPFVGVSGRLLTSMLTKAGIDRSACHLTNVFPLRPKDDDILSLCYSKKEAGKDYPYPAFAKGKYIKREYLHFVEELHTEIRSVNPKIVIALGNTPSWALFGRSGISSLRGYIFKSRSLKGIKVLPTFHPAGILRSWSDLHVTILDLKKALRHVSISGSGRPDRFIYVEPSIADLAEFERDHINSALELGVDIETRGEHITCISFATSPYRAIVLPIWDERKADGSYWPSLSEELAAMDYIKRWLESPIPKVGQNTLYDFFVLWQVYGLRVNNYHDDSMLLSHSLQPESPKGLGFLGSINTDECAWKLLSPKHNDTIKREDT